MLKFCNELKCQGRSKTWICKSLEWPATIACKKIANKIGVDFDIANLGCFLMKRWLCTLRQRWGIRCTRKKILFNVDLILLGQYCTGKNSVRNVVLEALDNIAQVKILCNGVLIVLGQHSTNKNPTQCYPSGSTQPCTRKNPFQYCLNTLGTTLHR